MAQMDAFSAQIVKFVREMPDEALLELVKQKLGVFTSPATHYAGRGPMKVLPVAIPASKGAPRDEAPLGELAARQTKRASASRPHRAPSVSAERQGLLDDVERVVKANAGLSASDVARLVSIPQTRAAAALRELKLLRRIFQGGDRRFARYAADLKTAEQASTWARKTAKGPMVPSRKTSVRARKRSQPMASAPAA